MAAAKGLANDATVLVLIQAGFSTFAAIAATTPENLLEKDTAARASKRNGAALAA